MHEQDAAEAPQAPGAIVCRGLRGATVVGADAAEVSEATVELIGALLELNGCARDDVAAVIFTLTDDLEGASPAAALRAHGWDSVPLLMTREHDNHTLGRCIRVLMLVNTARAAAELRHAYLRGSAVLRPDLAADLTPLTGAIS